MYHILIEKRTCAGQHRQNLLNKCPSMIKEPLSSLGLSFFLSIFNMHSAAYLFANQVHGSHFVQSTVLCKLSVTSYMLL